jgi:hypothetical protein
MRCSGAPLAFDGDGDDDISDDGSAQAGQTSRDRAAGL